MRTRYFVRVLSPFANYREGHEICLEQPEFDAANERGLVATIYEERDGKRVDVEAARAAPAAPVAAPTAETVPLDTLTDAEKATVEAAISKKRR